MALLHSPHHSPVRDQADCSLKPPALSCSPLSKPTCGHRGPELKGFLERISKLPFISSCTLGTMNPSYVIVTYIYVLMSNFVTLGYYIFPLFVLHPLKGKGDDCYFLHKSLGVYLTRNKDSATTDA